MTVADLGSWEWIVWVPSNRIRGINWAYPRRARERRREPREEEMTNTTSPPVWDAVAIANQLQTIAGQSQRLMQGFLSRQRAGGQIGMGDASTLGGSFLDLMTQMMSNPTALANAQIDLFNDSMTVWRHAAERMFLMRESDAEPARDKRFKHP